MDSEYGFWGAGQRLLQPPADTWWSSPTPDHAHGEPPPRPRASSDMHLVLHTRLSENNLSMVIIFISEAAELNLLPSAWEGTFLSSFTTGNRAWL